MSGLNFADDSEFRAKTAEVAGRLSPATSARFTESIDRLRAATPVDFTHGLNYAKLIGRSRESLDVDVAIHPCAPLDEDLNGDGGMGYVPEVELRYEKVDAVAAAQDYVRRLTEIFVQETRRKTATLIQTVFLQPGQYCPDIVSAEPLRALLRNVHSANVPMDGSGYLSAQKMQSFLLSMRHGDPMSLRGVNSGDIYWLHGHAYNGEVRQFAEQLFAALEFGVYLTPPEKGSSDQGPSEVLREAIVELELIRNSGGIRYGVVWDQENARKHVTDGRHISSQLTGMGTVIMPTEAA